MKTMNPVVHFELPYRNNKRMVNFYRTVFNWELNQLGAEMGNYILATTTRSDAKPGSPAGAINGGFFPVNADGSNHLPSIVIGVEDINETMKKIEANGGQILGEPYEIPGFGHYVAFTDSEENRLSIIQPVMS